MSEIRSGNGPNGPPYRLNVYNGKSAALALILSQEAPKQLASVVTGDDSAYKLAFPVRATKRQKP